MGPYEEYVDDLASLMEESTMDEPDDADNSKKGPSSQQKAEIHRRIKEHQRSQERADKAIKLIDKEKSEIHAYFFENPTDYSPVKSRRLIELNTLMEDHEKTWLTAQEEIEVLRCQSEGETLT